MPTMVTTNPAALPADWRDILALTKPRVMSLVVFSGLCGMLVAPQLPPFVLGFTAILCIALGAGACGALNQWYEADIDAKMRRTAKRPLPAGRMDRQSALHFGVGLSGFSVLLMGLATNWLAAGLLAASILFYVLVYTVWLKPRTAQNIVIGGAAGAFPPLIGWVAATGQIAVLPLLLFAIIFLWTPPHFWALSLFVRSDYAAAGIPMLPVVAGIENTRRQIFLYSLPSARERRANPGPDGAGEAFVRLFGFLPLRLVRGARRRPVAPMVRPEDEVIRKRQRERARIMAWLLGAFVVLLFFISIAKTGMNW
jgi:heme o synthase